MQGFADRCDTHISSRRFSGAPTEHFIRFRSAVIKMPTQVGWADDYAAEHMHLLHCLTAPEGRLPRHIGRRAVSSAVYAVASPARCIAF